MEGSTGGRGPKQLAPGWGDGADVHATGVTCRPSCAPLTARVLPPVLAPIPAATAANCYPTARLQTTRWWTPPPAPSRRATGPCWPGATCWSPTATGARSRRSMRSCPGMTRTRVGTWGCVAAEWSGGGCRVESEWENGAGAEPGGDFATFNAHRCLAACPLCSCPYRVCPLLMLPLPPCSRCCTAPPPLPPPPPPLLLPQTTYG